MFTFCFSEKLAFTLQPVSGVREVVLILIGGDCEINCDGSDNNCSVLLGNYVMKNVSFFDVRRDFMPRFKIKIHRICFSNFAFLQSCAVVRVYNIPKASIIGA
jgi:hypothetical protein